MKGKKDTYTEQHPSKKHNEFNMQEVYQVLINPCKSFLCLTATYCKVCCHFEENSNHHAVA